MSEQAEPNIVHHYQHASGSSVGMTSPTASQRGNGLPQIEAKVYYDAGVHGAAEAAMAQLRSTFQELLDWRPLPAGPADRAEP